MGELIVAYGIGDDAQIHQADRTTRERAVTEWA